LDVRLSASAGDACARETDAARHRIHQRDWVRPSINRDPSIDWPVRNDEIVPAIRAAPTDDLKVALIGEWVAPHTGGSEKRIELISR